MQRKFLVALLLFAAVFTASVAWADYVEINEKNFPDPVFRQYVRENCDDGNGNAAESGDNKLSASEINSVMTITLNYSSGYRGIQDLSGINYFTSLQTWDCSNQALTSLTLSLPSLKSLMCYGNQLTSLNVAACTGLDTLNCNSNKLSGDLDLSELGISTLDCSDNPNLYVMLPTIANDIGVSSIKCNNVASVGPLDSTALGAYLQTLECRNANLTTLVLSGKATYVTEIDVSENPNLTSITWDSTTQGQVFASINSINISGTQVGVQSTINTLSERSGNPTYFYANNMGYNMITLDISAFTNLKFLYLQGNHLTSLTLLDSMNSSYLYLYLESNDFEYVPSLPEKTQELHLANNKITSTGTLLNVSQDLEELDVSYNNLTESDLSPFTKLEKLNLSHNSLTADTLTLPSVIDYTSWANESPDIGLDLSYNNFSSLPAMPDENISVLDVTGNSLTALDVSGFTLLEELYSGYNNLTALDTTKNSKLATLWVD